MLYISTKSGRYKAATQDDIIAEATTIYNQYLCQGTVISCPVDAAKYIKLKLVQYEFEVFYVIFLATSNKILSCEEIARGTLDTASVYPREILRMAIGHNCKSVIFAHNHPSGSATPSEADKNITSKLKEVLALVDVDVLDHFICGEDIYSFAEHGLL
jgi:DNA repair protein RadC